MTRLRLLVVAGALAGALTPLGPSANAMACHPDFRMVCETLGLVCQRIADIPKSDVECPRMG